MSTASRRQVILPPNGQELSKIAAEEFQAELMRFFKTHLAYPNASIKIQWSANFYCAPHHFEGEQLIKVATEGVTETQLQEQQGLEPEMEMSSLEIGIQSPATSPVVTRPGLPNQPMQPAAASESRGRRDINARRGRGIEFTAGQPANEALASAGDQRAVVSGMREAVADLEVSAKQEPVHDSTIVIPVAGETSNG